MKEFLYWTFVRCWPLGETCEVNWDAWAALGTLGAVVVALRIANRDKLRRWDEADARMAVAYAKLLVPLEQWIQNLVLFAGLLQRPSESLSDAATAYSTKVPAQIIEAAGDMRDLGPATEPLLDAILRMEEATALQVEIDKMRAEPLYKGAAWAEEMMARYAWSVISANRAAQTARGLMLVRMNRVTSDTPWKTRYIDDVLRRYKEQGVEFPAAPARWWVPKWLIARLAAWDRWRIEVRAYRGK